MANNVYGTPEPTLSIELRKVIDKENVLTTHTKRRILDALDDHITNDQDQKDAINRRNIVQEIYTSEENYIKQLDIVIKYFKTPIEAKKLAPLSVLNALFGNLQTIRDVNSEFMDRLNESKDSIASPFLVTAPFFKVYSAYAYGYKNTLNILESMPKSNPQLYEFISKQETRPEVGSKLCSFLISPIQRIPRYLLLLKELKVLSPPSSFAYSELKEAIDELESIVDHIQNLMKEQENAARMMVIQRALLNGKPNIIAPGRRLIKEGKLSKVVKDNQNPRYVILLSDMILYCKNWTKDTASLKCLHVLPLEKCTVNAVGFKKGVFMLQCQSFSVVLSSNCELDNDANEWVESIQDAVEEVQANKMTLRRQCTHRRPLRRKEFNQLDDDQVSIANRKRRLSTGNSEINNGSPWKRMRACTIHAQKKVQDNNSEAGQSSKSTNNITRSESLSYVKRAKKFITSVKNTTQKLINDADPAKCSVPAINSKIATISNN